MIHDTWLDFMDLRKEKKKIERIAWVNAGRWFNSMAAVWECPFRSWENAWEENANEEGYNIKPS